jgi:hypothetical protein
MRINIEFDSWEEMEVFRTSGKKTRGKSQMTETEEAAELQASKADPTVTVAANPVPPQSFVPPAAQAAPTGFPGANGPTPPPPDKVVTAILARIDGAVNSGQSTDAIVNWFRQQIGPEATNATLEQIRNILIPRLTKPQLTQIAPQLGIALD